MTQNERILQYLKDGGSLTPMSALTIFGCGRLAARINDLKKQGHNIVSKKVRVGREAKIVSEYRMGGK